MSDGEIREFAKIFPLAPKSETIVTVRPLLEGTLPHIANVEYKDLGLDAVEKYLAQEVEREPVLVIQFYQLLHEQRKTPFPWYVKSEDGRKIIEAAASDPRSRDKALSLIDMLGQSGDHQYRDIYDRYAH